MSFVKLSTDNENKVYFTLIYSLGKLKYNQSDITVFHQNCTIFNHGKSLSVVNNQDNPKQIINKCHSKFNTYSIPHYKPIPKFPENPQPFSENLNYEKEENKTYCLSILIPLLKELINLFNPTEVKFNLLFTNYFRSYGDERDYYRLSYKLQGFELVCILKIKNTIVTIRYGGDSIDNNKIITSIYSELFYCTSIVKNINHQIKYSLVLSGQAAGLLFHEVLGHGLEADSKFKLEKSSQLSPLLSVYDDGTIINTSGYCPIDDELVLNNGKLLINNGNIVSHIHNLKTAKENLCIPTGNSRSENVSFDPQIRVTNTIVKPGDKTIDNIFNDIDYGIFIDSCSEGAFTEEFTITVKHARMINNGVLGAPVYLKTIWGNSLSTLESILNISKDVDTYFSIVPTCGKINQTIRIGYSSPVVQFANINIA